MSFISATANKKNYSIKKVGDDTVIEIPEKQQMIVIGDMEISAGGELVVKADSELANVIG